MNSSLAPVGLTGRSLPARGWDRRLTRWDRVGLGLLVLGLVAFGVVVEIRSAFQSARKTDFGVYARAGWAIRGGWDIYEVFDDRGWHYCYPPPFAVLMVPLADPPTILTDRTGYLPFAVSVGIWYVLSLAFAGYAAHAFAGAVLPDAVRGSRRWWYARTVPLLVCAGGIGFTLARGQVNTLVVALVAGMFAASVRGRTVAAGAWLAGAIALKVIPGLLLLYPVVRREWRAAIGLAAAGVVLFGVIPVAVWGIDGAVKANLRIVDTVLKPGTTGGGDQTRAKELTDATATDSQTIQAVIHNLRHPDRATRPAQADRATKLAHWGIGGFLTLLTAVVAWRRLGPAPGEQLVFLGCLNVLMLLVTPVSHMHYYAMAMPLVAGLWLRGLANRPDAVSAGAGTVWVLVAWGVLTAVPLFPWELTSWMRDTGTGVFATAGLWAVGLTTITGAGRRPEVEGAYFIRLQSLMNHQPTPHR